MTNLYNDLVKNEINPTLASKIMKILSDITQYLKDNTTDFKMIQQVFEVRMIFQEFNIQDQFGIIGTNKYQRLNKIIIKYCINFYFYYWILRNEIQNSREKQLEVVIHQSLKTKSYVEMVGGQARKFIE